MSRTKRSTRKFSSRKQNNHRQKKTRDKKHRKHRKHGKIGERNKSKRKSRKIFWGGFTQEQRKQHLRRFENIKDFLEINSRILVNNFDMENYIHDIENFPLYDNDDNNYRNTIKQLETFIDTIKLIENIKSKGSLFNSIDITDISEINKIRYLKYRTNESTPVIKSINIDNRKYFLTLDSNISYRFLTEVEMQEEEAKQAANAKATERLSRIKAAKEAATARIKAAKEAATARIKAAAKEHGQTDEE